MGKPLSFTQHALKVMLERQLLLAWIEQTVWHPEWVESDPGDPEVQRRFRAIVDRDNRILRVACVETDDNIRIISAFLDRRARQQ